LNVQTGDLRRSSRRRVLMRAALIGVDAVQQVRIRDLTPSGAGISCDVPLAAGSDVVLKRGDLFIAARVVWADGTSAGLEFYRPLPPEEVPPPFALAESQMKRNHSKR
jgi:hypothetical protein